MKKFITPVAIVLVTIFFISCHKLDEMVDPEGEWGHGHLQQTKTYSSEVAFKWMDMQLHLMVTNPTPLGGPRSLRYYTYGGIALYESVVPGMPSYNSLSGQLNGFPAMPATLRGRAYNWAVSGNSALAAMTRNFFTAATDENKARIDSLENALNEPYKMMMDTAAFQRSVQFGKTVAELVFDWSKTDGSADASAPYTPPVGLGIWVPTPPAFAPAANPYWGNNRTMVANCLDGVDPEAPPVYSEDPDSDYYKMMKEVYDASLTLTDDHKAVAIFYGSNPGYQGYGGGGYLSALKTVLVQENPQLDFTACVFAKASMGLNDAGVGVYKFKYQYNQQRPITFIRDIMGYEEWTSFITTPPFPDFPGAHSSQAGAFAETMEGFFGTEYHFTDHTYDFQGQAPRTYTSFEEMIQHIDDARFYGGIHSRISDKAGSDMGRKVAKNIDSMVKFKK